MSNSSAAASTNSTSEAASSAPPPSMPSQPSHPPAPSLAAVRDVHLQDLHWSELPQNPCFRSAGMWGLGIGGGLWTRAFFFRYKTAPPALRNQKAVNAFMFGLLAASSVSWIMCRLHAYRMEKGLRVWMHENRARRVSPEFMAKSNEGMEVVSINDAAPPKK